MPEHYLAYLHHIKQECEFLLTVKAEHDTLEDFTQNETAKRAVVRSLEIIGEATKNIPADLKLKWSSIEWKAMAGMRDRLIHDYMGVNYSIVWDVMATKIGNLHQQVETVISSESAE